MSGGVFESRDAIGLASSRVPLFSPELGQLRQLVPVEIPARAPPAKIGQLECRAHGQSAKTISPLGAKPRRMKPAMQPLKKLNEHEFPGIDFWLVSHENLQLSVHFNPC